MRGLRKRASELKVLQVHKLVCLLLILFAAASCAASADQKSSALELIFLGAASIVLLVRRALRSLDRMSR